MAALAFDTYKAVKALREAGADELLAEAVVATVGEAVSGNVATKADIAEVQAALKAEMAAVKAELKADLAEVKAELKADLSPKSKPNSRPTSPKSRRRLRKSRAELKIRPRRLGIPAAPPAVGHGRRHRGSDRRLSEADGLTGLMAAYALLRRHSRHWRSCPAGGKARPDFLWHSDYS